MFSSPEVTHYGAKILIQQNIGRLNTQKNKTKKWRRGPKRNLKKLEFEEAYNQLQEEKQERLEAQF